MPVRWSFGRLFILLFLFMLVGRIEPADAVIGSVNTPGYARWVKVSGTYAYVADDYGGLQVVDISNPKSPAIIGSVDTPGNAKKVFLSGSYAYVADYWDGFHIVDITTPASPAIVGSLSLPDAAEGVYVSGSYAYVADGSSGLKVINVSNPGAPAVIGGVNTTGYSHDIVVFGSYAYVADGSAGLAVINISNPAAPKVSGTAATPGVAKGISVSWPYVYLAAETKGIQVVNVADPQKPQIVGSLLTSGTCQSVYLAYPLLFTAADVDGLRVIDVSNPAAPYLRGTEVTSSSALGVHVVEGYAYMADYDYGLEVVDVRKYFSRIVGSVATPGSAQDVKVSGSYAYVAGDFGGLQVVDVNNPAAPVIVGSLATPGNAKGVFVAGSYAYVAGDASGLLVVNIDSPQTPTLAGSVATPGPARAVFVSGSCAYVADGSGGGLQVIDVSDPEEPLIIGDVTTPGSAENVQVVGPYAFVADGSAGGLQVIDVSVPQSPVIIGALNTTGTSYEVDVSGALAYVADGSNGLTVVDLTNPDSPVVVGGLETDSSARGIRVRGPYAFLTSYVDGLNIFDISDPFEPFIIVTVDTTGYAYKVELSGSYAYVADGPSGLQIIGVGNFPCDQQVPAAPGSISYPAADTDGTFPISWEASSFAQTYSLERADNVSFTGAISVYDGAATSFEQAGLFAGTFYYRVRAANDCGAGTWTVGAGINVSSFPARPGSISYAASSCGSNFAISWTPSTGATSYLLQRAADPSFSGAATVYTGSQTSFTEPSLNYGTHYYRVGASNGNGVSPWRTGGATTIVAPPQVPATFSYPTASCNGSLALTWSTVSGATSYTLQRATDPAFGDAAQVYLGPANAYSDTGIPGGTYYYRLQANNGCGSSSWKSGPGAGVSSIPAAPVAINYPSTNCGGTFTITWSSVAGATEYTLQRATTDNFSTATNVYTGSLTSFVQPALASGTYYYRVRAGNACGAGTWTGGGAITVTSLPAVPGTITYPQTLCGSSVTVSWASATRATSYILQRATNASFSGATEIYSGPATTFGDTGLLNNSYYYRVKAVNDCGGSDWRSGAAVSVTTIPSSPETISYPENNCSGSFTVTWATVAGATGYTVQRATSPSFTDATAVYTGLGTSLTQIGLTDGTYYFRVRAGNGCGESGWKGGTAVTVSSLPAVPGTITYPQTLCGSSITVSWASASRATSYILQRATNASFSGATEIYNGPATAFGDTGLLNTSYYYRVKAVNDCGGSDWRSGSAVSVTTIPPSPEAISYPESTCSGSFTVTWTTVAGATGYSLQRATSPSFADATTVYTGPGGSSNQTGLADGTYYFRVRAGNGCGESGWKDGAAVKVSSLPAVPGAISYPPTNCGTAFTVTWGSATGATDYILQRATTANFSDAVDVFTGASTSFSQTVLPAASYYYRVRASNGCGLSNWQQGTAIVVTATPSRPAAISYPQTNCTGTFTVTWGSVGNAGSYTLQRAIDPSFSDAVAVFTNSGTSFVQTGLAEGTYYFRVRANNDCGSSTWRNGDATTVTGTMPPPAAISYPAASCSGAFKVSWDAVNTATGYSLQRATNSSFTDAQSVYTGTATFFDQTALAVGTYYYRVLANSTCGSSIWQAGPAMMVITTPGAPGSISYPTGNCGGSFTVTWPQVNGATGYLLQRASNVAFTGATQVYSGAGASFQESGLSVGTYYYRVLAKNDCGSSGWAAGTAVAVTATPSLPASITYSPTTCNGTVAVSWSTVSGATSYTLQRATVPNFADAATVYSGAAVSFNQTGLANGTYYFQVRAGNDCGTSGWKTGPAVAVTAIPPAPGSLSYPAGICGVSFMVSWADAQGATSYALQRATDSMFSNAVTVYNGASSYYNETVPGSGTYYYRVSASNGCGTGAWISGQAVAATPSPATPLSITYPATSCSGNYTINWSAVDGATNYALQRSMDPAFGDGVIVYSGSATSYVEPGLGLGTFYYRVRATNGCGIGDWRTGGAVAIASSPAPSPPAEINYPSGSAGESFTVTWSAVAGAAGYTLQRAATAAFADAIEVYTGTANSFSQSGLANGTYYYRVRANSDCGNSGWQPGNAIVVSSNRPPVVSAPPQGPALGTSAASYTFTAGASDPDGNPIQYRFSWGDGKTSSWSTKASRTHQWSVSNTYCVKAQAMDSQGAVSAWSECATIVVSRPPVLSGPPVGPSTGKVGTSCKFGGQATDPDGDPIQYRFSWGDGKSSSWATKTTASHTWRVPATYCVKLQAIDSKGLKSAWSGCTNIQIAE